MKYEIRIHKPLLVNPDIDGDVDRDFNAIFRFDDNGKHTPTVGQMIAAIGAGLNRGGFDVTVYETSEITKRIG